MTIEYRQKALEALAHYNISATEIELLRHNENPTYRVGNEYLLQILLHFARICHLSRSMYKNRDTGSLDKSAQTGAKQSILKGKSI